MYGLHTSASLFIISPITSAYWCGYSSPTATVLHQSPRPKKTVIGKNDDGKKSSKNNRKSPHSPDAVNPDDSQDDEQSMTNRPDRDKESLQKKTKNFIMRNSQNVCIKTSPRYTQHEDREQGKYGKTKENNTENHASEREKIVTSKTAWDDAERRWKNQKPLQRM